MTNRELLESWPISSITVQQDFSQARPALEEHTGAQEWKWKLLGLATLLGVSAGGWAGMILAARHFTR